MIRPVLVGGPQRMMSDQSPGNLSNELSTDRSLSAPRQALILPRSDWGRPSLSGGDAGEVCRITLHCPVTTTRRMLSENTARMGQQGKAVRRGERRRLCCLVSIIGLPGEFLFDLNFVFWNAALVIS
jgi:hypothetical protein